MANDENYEDSEDELEENEITSCPACGRDYDDADADFQICHFCGFNANKWEYEK